MENEFDEVMRQHSDAELIEILDSEPGDYLPTAMEAARREFQFRNLSEEKINQIGNKIKQEKYEIQIKANEPLSMAWKILAFVFPGMIPIFFAGNLKSDGYEKKYQEALKYTLYGMLFYGCFIILLATLRFDFHLPV